MTVGTNVNLLWTSTRKITIDPKENTCLKKSPKSNVSSKNFKKDVKKNVSSNQMVSKMKSKSFRRTSSKQIVSKTKTESGMLKKICSVESKIDTTRVPRFVDMSTIKRKRTRRRRIVSKYPSTNLFVKKAKASTSLLNQDGNITYNKFSTTYYDDLLKIPPTRCVSPFGPWRTSKNRLSSEIAAQPSRLTSCMYLKKDAKDQYNSTSETDVCNTTTRKDDEDITNTSSSNSKPQTFFFPTNIETDKEVSSLATDSVSIIKTKLHDVASKSFVEEPKLRKSRQGDENKRNNKKVTNYNDIKEDEHTQYFSTASSSIIKVRPNDVTPNGEPKLGKSGYQDGNKKNGQKVTNFHYNGIKADQQTHYISTASPSMIKVKPHDVTPNSSVGEPKLGKFGYGDENEKNEGKVTNFHYDIIEEDKNVASTGPTEEISIEDSSTRSVVNAEIFNNTGRRAKSRSRYKVHRKKCVKNDCQLEPNLWVLGDSPQNVEIHKLISIKNDCTMEHAKTESNLERRKAKYKNATQSATEVKRFKSRSESKNRKNSKTSKKITKTESYSEDQKRNNIKTNNLTYLKSAVRTNSEINDNDTMAYAKENRRPESSDSQKSGNLVCSTMHSSGENRTNDENRIKMAYSKEIANTEFKSDNKQKKNIKIHLTLASPRSVKITDCYVESQKGTNIETNITVSHATENRSHTRTGFLCNTMHYRAVHEGSKSRSEIQKTSNTVAYPKEITNTEFYSSNQEKIIIFYLFIYFLFIYLTQYVKRSNTLASPKSVGRTDLHIEGQKGTNFETNRTVVYAKRYRRTRSSAGQKCNTIHYNAVGERPTTAPERQNGTNLETSDTTVYPKKVSKMESVSDNREDNHISTNNTLVYPTGVRRVRSYLESQKITIINSNNIMSYPKPVKIVDSKSRIHYKTSQPDSGKKTNAICSNTVHYNTEMGKSKSYSENQNRTNSIITIYPKNVEKGETYSESQEMINSVDNNNRQYTTGIERPKSCPESQKRMVSFTDLQRRLRSLYANITHCMTDFERTKYCLAYIERVFPKGIDNVEFYSDIQNRMNIIYRNIKHFTIELEKTKDWKKRLYLY